MSTKDSDAFMSRFSGRVYLGSLDEVAFALREVITHDTHDEEPYCEYCTDTYRCPQHSQKEEARGFTT